MRQLIDLLNSIAGSASRLQAGMQPADAAALAAAGPARLCGRDRGRRITSSGVAAGSILPIGGPTAAAAPPLPPMSPVAAAALPVLRAAEAALEAKLAGNAAACDADFMQLHILNERLARELRFTAAEARRDLNRWVGGWEGRRGWRGVRRAGPSPTAGVQKLQAWCCPTQSGSTSAHFQQQ